MAIKQEVLGKRVRDAREMAGLTQDVLAGHLGVSRSTVTQMELGNRVVTGLELSKIAFLFGRDIQCFVSADDLGSQDALVALFRLHPDLADQEDMLDALRRCLALGRELTQLESLLGVNRDLTAVANYRLPKPVSKWDAIQQGERVAAEERRRLGLGRGALPDLAEVLEVQGIRTGQVKLPDDISGLTLIEPQIGYFVVANVDHHVLRRRFSYAHEYCHVLLDGDQHGIVSRGQDRHELLEVRANAFAANFLMPSDAVSLFVGALGKGHPSRMEAEVFDENEAVRGRARSAPGSQDIQIYDVVQLAHHFGVSRPTACYRLRSARLLSQAELNTLLKQDQSGRGREVEILLGLPQRDHVGLRNQFRHRFVGLALEALRREEISQAKLVEIAAMVGVTTNEVDEAVWGMGLADDCGTDVAIPVTG